MQYVAVLVIAAGVAASAAHAAAPPVIIMGVDGLSARAAQRSDRMMSILNESQYTLRGRTTEHSRSFEGWPSILQGGYDLGVERPTLFGYVRSQLPNAVLWVYAQYEGVRDACGPADADQYLYLVGMKSVVDTFETKLAALRVAQNNASAAPTLAVLYGGDIDFFGHSFYWDSYHSAGFVNDAADHIRRVRQLVPNAVIYIVSDHGGQGGGHSYFGRNQHNDATNIDAPIFRDVPWARWPSSGSPDPIGPIRAPVRNDDTAYFVSVDLGIAPQAWWRHLVGGLDVGGSPEAVSARVSDATHDAGVSACIMLFVCLFAHGLLAP